MRGRRITGEKKSGIEGRRRNQDRQQPLRPRRPIDPNHGFLNRHRPYEACAHSANLRPELPATPAAKAPAGEGPVSP